MFTNYDNAYDYTLDESENDYFNIVSSRFITDSREIVTVMFEEDKEDLGRWVCGWSRSSSQGNSQENTGQGDAIKIFSTIIAMIVEVALGKQVRSMTFTSPDPGKGKLLIRIFNKLTSEYGYIANSETHKNGVTIRVHPAPKELIDETV